MLYCFFFNDTATTEIYTLSLHDALPIYRTRLFGRLEERVFDNTQVLDADGIEGRIGSISFVAALGEPERAAVDRKSTRLNSSHANISYAVFCLKKKKTLTTLFSIPSYST